MVKRFLVTMPDVHELYEGEIANVLYREAAMFDDFATVEELDE
jgi:hypothetical protein